MSSIPECPLRGSDVTVHITRVHLHPLCVLVEFWGKFSQERITDYEGLDKEIQSPGAIFKDSEGNPGDQCLVQIDSTWYRSRIVSRNGTRYSVFLIDKGMAYTTTTTMLAWGKKEHFHLPPEVEFCVLANMLPLSSENRWSPMALEFLKSLTGKSVTAHVQDILEAHKVFLLHIPCISKQMYEMGFAKKLSSIAFQDIVLMSLQSHSGAVSSPGAQLGLSGSGTQLHKQELFMYPELQEGTVETVVVTEVTNPQRIFCQLKVFSKELNKVSEKISQNYEGRGPSCRVSPDMIGFPCAARGSDGGWYRSVLQQVFPANKVVEVFNVDYGTKQIVQVENVRPLAAEFFRMPVVTYICSLHGIIDKGVGWTASQINFLKSILLNKIMIAKFEYQSISEGVYYVTLYGDDNANMNTLFGSKVSCLLECEKKTLGDYSIQSSTYSLQHLSQQERVFTFQQTAEENDEKAVAGKPPSEELALNSSHLAVVQHIYTPSEFWVQTKNYKKELDELLDSMHHLYQESANMHVVKDPICGLYCAAKAEDGEFYRATVTEAGETQVTVFFVDYGNMEVVDRSNIRTLPPEFKKIPQLALKCSLDGVKPKNGKWSESALDFFFQAATDKELNVHVKAKHSDSYAVELTDPKAQGEKNISTQMCHSGLTEKAEIQTQPTVKGTMKTAYKSPPHLADERLACVNSNSGIVFQSAFGLAGKKRSVATFKEYKFPIGSVIDVSVSYIESPNDFWCQQVQNAGHLQLLMQDLQAHYANSRFEPNIEMACVARHPINGMWYRALVIHKHETPLVDVLFVDYGQTETVSLYDLRKICPEFLTLHGQAFRCSLLNPINTTSAINEWKEETTAKFQQFVEMAASDFFILKCTIYAIMYSEQMIVYNIVDLETPFESISNSMANLVPSVLPKQATGPKFSLDTYYYSTHNVKTGTTEQVTVTCVKSVSQFYCHLDKNVDVIQDLKMKVNSVCHQLEKVKPPTVFGTLCFARYSDGEWYRAQIKTTRPAVCVHFVDYGDTIEVEKSDLLPVPKEAHDIMSVPVQSVLCGLSDIPTNVPCEVNKWFETTATDCQFQALIVAREPDGKLLVELYHGNTQINAKIRKEFQIEVQTKKQVVHQGCANHAQKTLTAFPNQTTDTEDHNQAPKMNSFTAPKPVHQMNIKEKLTDVNLNSVQKTQHREKGHIRPTPLKLYKPPHQRHPGTIPENNFETGDGAKPRRDYPPPEPKQPKSQSPKTETPEANDAEKLPTLADLPTKSITPGVSVDVLVSHCNNPLSFYVQCVSEENELFSLVEKLNESESTSKDNIKDVHPGDLIQAEFADDSSWYRAVVKELSANSMALVEFVDFGNTSVTPVFKMGRLHKTFLEFPVYSIHCMLSDAAVLGEERVLSPDVVSGFKEDIGCCGEKVLQCQFTRQVGSMWEVRLEDSGVDIVCKVPSGGRKIATEKQWKEQPAHISDLMRERENSEKFQANSCSLHYQDQNKILEGEQLDAYITAINDDLTFWCQSANSEELEKISLGLSETGNAAEKQINPETLFPKSPCIALFSDDQLWYRAEVISKKGDELSVRFVDYGNTSHVNTTDVREIPPVFVQIPPQVFLCELEGFDTSCGFWNSNALDELYALTSDKLLQLTVTSVIRSDGKMKCLVQMECERQLINERMKTWWKGSKTANVLDSVDLTEPPLQLSSTTSAPKDQQKHPDLQGVFSTAFCFPLQSECHEEQSADKLTDTSSADEDLKLTNENQDELYEDSVHMETIDKAAMQNSIERGNLPATGMHIKDILSCGSVTDGICSVDKDGPDTLSMSCNVIVTTGEEAEESTSEVCAPGQEDLHSPLKENIVEAIDELETETPDKENPSTYSLDNELLTDADKVKRNGEVAVSMSNTVTCTTASKMVPLNALPQDKMDTVLNVSKQAELMPTSLDLTVKLCGTSTEQDTEAGDDITEEEGQREIPSHMAVDSGSEVEASGYEEETQSARLEDKHAAVSEEHCYTDFSLEPADDLEELTSGVEETCSAGIFTEQNSEAGDNVTEDEGQREIPSHLKTDTVSEEEPSAYEEETHSALLEDAAVSEEHCSTDFCPEPADDLEELTSGVEETCSAAEVEQSSLDEAISAGAACLNSVTAEEISFITEDFVPAVEDDVLCDTPTAAGQSDEVRKESVEGPPQSSVRITDEASTCISDEDKLTEEESLLLYDDELPALPADTESQINPDVRVVDELMNVAEEICLADTIQDSEEAEAETEDCDECVPTLPQNKDPDDGTLTEETFSFDEDSFETLLSRMTHLTLIVKETLADVVFTEQQSEE